MSACAQDPDREMDYAYCVIHGQDVWKCIRTLEARVKELEILLTAREDGEMKAGFEAEKWRAVAEKAEAELAAHRRPPR